MLKEFRMGSYLFRRLLNLIPILIGISFLSFVLINLSPSDPAEVAVRVNEVTPTEEVLAETRAKLGLDKPFLTRYVAWLNNSLHGDFGNRYVDDKPVLGEIQKALPATLVLAGAALCLTLVCSLSAGIVCALYEGTFLDLKIKIIKRQLLCIRVTVFQMFCFYVRHNTVLTTTEATIRTNIPTQRILSSAFILSSLR